MCKVKNKLGELFTAPARTENLTDEVEPNYRGTPSLVETRINFLAGRRALGCWGRRMTENEARHSKANPESAMVGPVCTCLPVPLCDLGFMVYGLGAELQGVGADRSCLLLLLRPQPAGPS